MNSGFGSFGSPSGFNTGSSLFSSSQNRPGGLFGSSTTTQPTSTGGGLFGSSSTTTPSTSSFGFGSTAATSTTTTQTGTGNVKFSAPGGQDTVTKNGVQSTIQTNHQCITAMKEYESKSLEELRLEDYQANRKFPQTTSGFTSSTGMFGSSSQPSTTSGFGGSLFSATSTASKPFGSFGSPATTTTPSTSTSLFGSTQTKPAFGSFGTTQTSTTSSPFGGFGTTTQPSTATTGFGASTQPSTGLFGSSSTPSTGTGLFGSTNQPTTSTGGLFGSSTQTQQQKPLFGGFGASSTTSTTAPAFSFAQPSQPSQPSTSIFGQSTTQSPLSANKPFGGFGTGTSTTTGFGSTPSTTPSTGLFGSTQQKPAFGLGSTTTGTTGSTGFGTGFGSTTTTGTTGTTGSLFGSGFGTQPSTTTTTPFGSTPATTTPFGTTGTTGGLFGSTQPSTTTTGTGLFGSSTAPTTTTSGFGSSPFGTGLQTSTQPSIFGSTTTPSTGGLFGSSTSTQPSSFGMGSGLGSTTAPSSGLSFGAQPTSAFGSGLTQQSTLASQTAQPTAPTVQPLIQQQLMALSNSPYGTANLLKTQLQDYSKKEDIFKPVSPIAQRPYITEATSPTKASSVLSQTLPEFKGGLSMTLKLTPKPRSQVKNKTDIFEGLDEEETPVFYPRKNIKKLMFKPQIEQSARLSTSNSSINGDCQFIRKANIFSDQAQITNDLTNVSDDGTQTTDNQSENGLMSSMHPAGIVLERPGYFTIPSMSDLANMIDPKTGDCLVDNFAIGRVDYGCITFPGVTNLANLNLDEIVHIRRKEVHVYPDDSKKPAVGEGLNKPAEVTLHRIWPLDKQTKMPITDPNRVIGSGYNKKIEKVTISMDAEFIDYDPVTGSWTFKVKHFSKYGLDDSDDEETDVGQINLAKGGTLDPAKKEMDMIERQRKLIELRRFELMQQSKKKLSTITNQPWDIIKEYAPANDKKMSDSSSLEFSSNETTDADNETVDSDDKKQSVCKQLILDGEKTPIDENKENRLYPNLAEYKGKENRIKTLYPNLESLEINSQHVELVDGNEEETKIESEEAMDQVPIQFEKFQDTRKLAETFFNDEQEDNFFAKSYSDDYQFTKLTSFSYKPITTGSLLKRGLGGISTLDKDNKLTIGDTSLKLSSSLIGDQFHGQPKVQKNSLVEVQKKLVPKALKPQLWNRFKIQKPSHLVQRRVPSEKSDDKYAPESQLVPCESAKSVIQLKDSFTNNLHWCLSDLGLFNSRKFRVNWSMNPSAYTFTQLSSFSKNSTFRNICQINSLNTLSMTDQISSSKLDIIKENIEKFLEIQLGLTDFVSRTNLFLLKTKSGNELVKNFDECAENLRNTIGDNPDADNIENMRIVLNLCFKLWGDIPDELKSENYDSNMNQYETEQIRKRLLSEWITQVSSHRIEKECKSLKFNKGKENYLNAIFSYLSGNRILDACNIAIDNSDYRLALILSQSSGSNDTVRKIMKKQLDEWYQSNSDKFINNDRIKIYTLISGEVVYNISDLQTRLINVCENLDWKRQFGIHLWYQSLPINSITDALDLYEKSVQNEICDRPMPSYVEESVSISKNVSDLYDTCFHLIKLYCNSEYPIEKIVHPLNHGSNRLDFRLSWHLTMALQALQYNHIAKFSMETLHNNFAEQLQSVGLWHWAIYVLMHIEDDQRREKFVRLYLSRNVSTSIELNESEQFLVEKLKVPSEWVYEYKALKARYEHLDENQLELLLRAHKWNESHHVLVEQIAPDLFITRKYEKLSSYLNLLSKESNCISKWNYGGQVYLDFIKLHQKQDFFFKFEQEEEEKVIDDETIAETNEQLMNLSARLKEFDTKSSKKLLCSLVISQLVLKYFNVLNEMMGVNEQEMDEVCRKMTKQNVEKAEQITLLVPDQDLLRTVMLKKVIYSKIIFGQKKTRSRN